MPLGRAWMCGSPRARARSMRPTSVSRRVSCRAIGDPAARVRRGFPALLPGDPSRAAAGVSETGDPAIPALGADLDIRTDICDRAGCAGRRAARRQGRVAWRSGQFRVGCSFSFEEALLQADVPRRPSRHGEMARRYLPHAHWGGHGPCHLMRPMKPQGARARHLGPPGQGAAVASRRRARHCCRKYRDIREALLVKPVRGTGVDERKLLRDRRHDACIVGALRSGGAGVPRV